MSSRVLVTGAGGFIGHHLVNYLEAARLLGTRRGFEEARVCAHRRRRISGGGSAHWESALEATRGVDQVFGLAADMGGMGFISAHHAMILHNNSLININTLEAARQNGVQRYLFSSSACVYPEFKQTETNVAPLKEEDAYPAQPQDAYGWEKLVTERLCLHYGQDYGMETRIFRFHNMFGPLGTWEGGREKAPAALSRKIAMAKLTGNPEIEIWGDGEQTRSFCYIDDCIQGLHRLMQSDFRQPLNLGSEQMVTINELADMIAGIAGISVRKKHIAGPMGVRGRNSDNTLLRKVLGWAPQISLEEGLARTYPWIESQVKAKLEQQVPAATRA